MITHKQLEETLAAQRTKRIHPAAFPLHKKNKNLISGLVTAIILIVSGAAMFFAVAVTTPKAGAMPTATSATSSASKSITISAAPIAMQVCTDIPNGRLHVRFAAGEGSEVRGYLVEGEAVQLAPVPDSEMFRETLWLHIASPIAGWVNARYVCKQEK